MALKHKIQGLNIRFQAAFKQLPKRLIRLAQHFRGFCWSSAQWWLGLLYLLLDVVALPEFYETLLDFVKWNTRPISSKEYLLLYPIFGNSINYKRIRIDERSYLGPKQKQFCYVSFYTINSWGTMNEALLIHEVVHIWQFQQLGSIYIPLALAAQRTKENYNYGGAPRIAYWASIGGQLTDFNLEQQADIVADYWRISKGWSANWGPAGLADLPNYQFLVQQLKGVKVRKGTP